MDSVTIELLQHESNTNLRTTSIVSIERIAYIRN